MEVYKINDINSLLKEDITYSPEILGLKANIERYISNYFAPSLNLKLDMDLNVIVDGTYQAICFDQMALIRSIANLLDINISTVSADDLNDYLSVKLAEKLRELKSITTEEDLLIKFPTISGIYQTKKERITKSVSLEEGCKIFKPVSEGEAIKYQKLREAGISREEHKNNLVEAYTFNILTFLCTYAYDTERVITYLDYLRASISQSVMPVSNKSSIDLKKLAEYIRSSKIKQRGLK